MSLSSWSPLEKPLFWFLSSQICFVWFELHESGVTQDVLFCAESLFDMYLAWKTGYSLTKYVYKTHEKILMKLYETVYAGESFNWYSLQNEEEL